MDEKLELSEQEQFERRKLANEMKKRMHELQNTNMFQIDPPVAETNPSVNNLHLASFASTAKNTEVEQKHQKVKRIRPQTAPRRPERHRNDDHNKENKQMVLAYSQDSFKTLLAQRPGSSTVGGGSVKKRFFKKNLEKEMVRGNKHLEINCLR